MRTVSGTRFSHSSVRPIVGAAASSAAGRSCSKKDVGSTGTDWSPSTRNRTSTVMLMTPLRGTVFAHRRRVDLKSCWRPRPSSVAATRSAQFSDEVASRTCTGPTISTTGYRSPSRFCAPPRLPTSAGSSARRARSSGSPTRESCDSVTRDEHDGVPYLVLDLVEGEPLSAVIERGPLDETGVQRMGVALAGALAHAHDARDRAPGREARQRPRRPGRVRASQRLRHRSSPRQLGVTASPRPVSSSAPPPTSRRNKCGATAQCRLGRVLPRPRPAGGDHGRARRTAGRRPKRPWPASIVHPRSRRSPRGWLRC